jgi:hypothetical protein
MATAIIETTTSNAPIKLSGSPWQWKAGLTTGTPADVREADDDTIIPAIAGNNYEYITSLELRDYDLDASAAAAIVQLLRRNASHVKCLKLHQCTGHTDIVLTVAMTLINTTMEFCCISIGRLATAASSPCVHAIGVGLQINSSLKELVLQSGSNVFFTLSEEAASSLEHGLAGNSTLETLDLKCCRFATGRAVRVGFIFRSSLKCAHFGLRDIANVCSISVY